MMKIGTQGRALMQMYRVVPLTKKREFPGVKVKAIEKGIR